MANQAHLEILRRGVDIWNHWREENPEVQIDLIDADLERVDLSHANLRGAILCNASLSYGNLSEADLRDADLTGASISYMPIIHADLSNATFDGARMLNSKLDGSNLKDAEFQKADLTDASLKGAHLIKTNFTRANLMRAHFESAEIDRAIFEQAVLEDAYLNSEGAIIHANMYRAHMSRIHLEGANLQKAVLIDAVMDDAHLEGANLSGTEMANTSLVNAKLIDAKLVGAYLPGADLSLADLSGADFTGADLSRTTLVQVNLERAIFTACRVYGCSVWDLQGEPASQKDLIITSKSDPDITVDNIKVAQFIYLILNNQEIRDVINTLTSKTVLILGRFAPERKAVLDAIREELRRRNYVPILFDFERPKDLDFTETIMTLAGMCHFIIADITNPSSSPLELQATVPNYGVPFVPIIQKGERPFSMFKDLLNKHANWVLSPLAYDTTENLIKKLEKAVINPALELHKKLTIEKAKDLVMRDLDDY